MYVVVNHQLTDPPAAFQRGQKLMTGEGAPEGARVLQFFPSRDSTAVMCLWRSSSVAAVQSYVDDVLGDASINSCYEVDTEHAFADQPTGLDASPAPAR